MSVWYYIFGTIFMWGIFGGTAFVLIRKLVIPVVKLLGVRFKCSKKVIAEYDHEEKSGNEGDVDRESFFWWKRSAVLYMADQAAGNINKYKVYYRYKVDGEEYVSTDGVLYTDSELANFGKNMMIYCSPEDPSLCMIKKQPEAITVVLAFLGALMSLACIAMMFVIFLD